MAATIAAMAMINAKCFNSPKLPNPTKQISKPTSLLCLQNLPKGLTATKSAEATTTTNPSASIVAGAVFAALSGGDAAMAAQQIAEIAEGDNRGLALLLPLVPAVAWVLFNILQPALNQINRMRSTKGLMVGLGLGGLVGSGLVGWTPDGSAAEVAMVAEAASDNRGQLLLFVVTPAILWVLFNILQPALNQLNRMRSQ